MKKTLLLILIFALAVCGYSNEKVATMEEFGKPENITFGNGYMYILEGTSIHIYKDSDFSYVKRFGKEGEGPGELKKSQFGGPMLVLPHNGKVFVSNSSKVSIFSATGDFIEEHKIAPFDIYMPFADKFVCMSNAAMDSDPQVRVLALFLADKKFAKGKMIYKSDFQVGMNASFTLPISPFQPAPMGKRLFIVAGKEGFAINELDLEGNIVNKIRKKGKNLSIDNDYKEKTINWFKTAPNFKNIYPYIKDRIKIKEHFPPIFFMIPDNNKLYIATNTMKGNNRECIVTDTKGKELRRVYLPLPHVYGFDNKYPYIIYKDYFYKLEENVDDETWELIRTKI